jgi:hypothetical protein
MAASGGGVAAGAAAVASGLQASPGAEVPAARVGTDGIADPAATVDGSTGRAVPARVRAEAATVSAPAAEPPPLNLPPRTGGRGAARSATGPVVARGIATPRASGTSGAATAVRPPAPGAWPTGRSAAASGPVTARQPAGAPPRQAPSQPASHQAGHGSRLRVPEALPPPGRRPPETVSGRQRSALRTQSATGRPEADKRADGQPVAWQGQPMTGPLARRADVSERPVPFWLRPARRR